MVFGFLADVVGGVVVSDVFPRGAVSPYFWLDDCDFGGVGDDVVDFGDPYEPGVGD